MLRGTRNRSQQTLFPSILPKIALAAWKNFYSI